MGPFILLRGLKNRDGDKAVLPGVDKKVRAIKSDPGGGPGILSKGLEAVWAGPRAL